MWKGVTARFRGFHADLHLTEDQIEDGLTKQLGIRQCLQRAYWGPTTDNPPGFVVGSWGKGTAVRPPNDIDLFMPLPIEVYNRFESNTGNIQSALLQEVKDHLVSTYSQTKTRGDGQVVVVAFNTITVEVVPVFNYDSAGKWLIPDTNGGGSWKFSNPGAEVQALDYAETVANRNVRKLIQMMKVWREHCSVPLKSFQLEVLVTEFLTDYEFLDKDWFYFDWFVRDFLRYLISRKNTYIWAPNSGDLSWLGEDWVSRAETAYGRALKACDYERDDFVTLAGGEWQKIFGSRIPEYV
jgi:hypothetical protein